MKNKKISKSIYENIIIAVAIMLYFLLINFAYGRLEKAEVLIGLKIASIIILAIAIVFIEIAYRKDNGKIAINSIEVLVLASHTLSIAHVVEAQKLEFTNYILISSYTFSIYYLFKAAIMYTKEKKAYLDSLSDIKEIVTNTPTKKEAVKKNKS